MSREKFLPKNYLDKLCNNINALHSEQKRFGRFSQNRLQRVHRIFLKKLLFEKLYNFKSIFVLWAKVSDCCPQHWNIHSPENKLEDKIQMYNVSDVEQKKVFGGLKTDVYLSKEMFWGFAFKTNHPILWDKKTLSGLCKNALYSPEGLPNQISYFDEL